LINTVTGFQVPSAGKNQSHQDPIPASNISGASKTLKTTLKSFPKAQRLTPHFPHFYFFPAKDKTPFQTHHQLFFSLKERLIISAGFINFTV